MDPTKLASHRHMSKSTCYIISVVRVTLEERRQRQRDIQPHRGRLRLLAGPGGDTSLGGIDPGTTVAVNYFDTTNPGVSFSCIMLISDSHVVIILSSYLLFWLVARRRRRCRRESAGSSNHSQPSISTPTAGCVCAPRLSADLGTIRLPESAINALHRL